MAFRTLPPAQVGDNFFQQAAVSRAAVQNPSSGDRTPSVPDGDPFFGSAGDLTRSDWASLITGAYASGQTSTDFDDAAGAIAAVVQGGPVALFVYAIVNVFSRERAKRRQQKEIRRRAERRIEIPDSKPVDLPLAFGYVRQPLINVFAATGDATGITTAANWNWNTVDNIPMDNGLSIGRLPGERADFFTAGIDQGPNSRDFLLAQYDISANEVIASMTWWWITYSCVLYLLQIRHRSERFLAAYMLS